MGSPLTSCWMAVNQGHRRLLRGQPMSCPELIEQMAAKGYGGLLRRPQPGPDFQNHGGHAFGIFARLWHERHAVACTLSRQGRAHASPPCGSAKASPRRVNPWSNVDAPGTGGSSHPRSAFAVGIPCGHTGSGSEDTGGSPDPAGGVRSISVSSPKSSTFSIFLEPSPTDRAALLRCGLGRSLLHESLRQQFQWNLADFPTPALTHCPMP